MPDRSKSISAAAPIPRIDPASWEEGEGFRETLLLHITDPDANATLRSLGSLLFNLSLEGAEFWPRRSESETRSELRAVLADLRHLEGFLSSLGREREVSSLSPSDDELSRFAGEQAPLLAQIADKVERTLGEVE